MVNDVITGWHIEGVDNPSEPADKNRFTGASTAAVADTTLHEAVIKDFVASVKNNREPAVSGPEAALATEIILEIYANNIYS
jgi:hypothetical protein